MHDDGSSSICRCVRMAGHFPVKAAWHVILVVLAVCTGVCLAGAVKGEPLLDVEARNRIDSLVEGAIARRVTPSAAIVVGTADRILFARAYGRHTYDDNSPAVTLDTIYDLASVSKAVGTTSATMLLVQDGKLSLDDPVCKYIRAWDRDDKRNITIRHLLSHTSGLPAYTRAERAEAERLENESRPDALIRHIASLPLRYETGKGCTYSCLNFITLARINEEVAGKSQEEFLRERVLGPLRMRDTGYYLSDDQKSRAAPTTGGRNGRQGDVHDPLAAYYSDGYHCGGNAGLFSSAGDLAAFCQMMLADGRWDGRQILAPETIDLFVRNSLPLRLRKVHGLGWGRYLFPPYATRLNRGYAKAAFGHGGYTGTFIRIDRLAGTFFILLTNRVFPDDRTSEVRLRREILRIILEAEPLYEGLATHRRGRR